MNIRNHKSNVFNISRHSVRHFFRFFLGKIYYFGSVGIYSRKRVYIAEGKKRTKTDVSFIFSSNRSKSDMIKIKLCRCKDRVCFVYMETKMGLFGLAATTTKKKLFYFCVLPCLNILFSGKFMAFSLEPWQFDIFFICVINSFFCYSSS